MSIEDRLAFMEGKKAELSAIFENNVWEIEMNSEKVLTGGLAMAKPKHV